MTKAKRKTHEEVKAGLAEHVRRMRDAADEAARMMGGVDDPTYPHDLDTFRDWRDFVDRVARPLVEAEDDEAAEQAAMRLYRKVSPYYICASMVMMANRLEGPPSGLIRPRDKGE